MACHNKNASLLQSFGMIYLFQSNHVLLLTVLNKNKNKTFLFNSIYNNHDLVRYTIAKSIGTSDAYVVKYVSKAPCYYHC